MYRSIDSKLLKGWTLESFDLYPLNLNLIEEQTSKKRKKNKKNICCTRFTKLSIITQIQTHPPVEPKTKTKARNLKNSKQKVEPKSFVPKSKTSPLAISNSNTLQNPVIQDTTTVVEEVHHHLLISLSLSFDSRIYGGETKTMSMAPDSHLTHIFNSW